MDEFKSIDNYLSKTFDTKDHHHCFVHDPGQEKLARFCKWMDGFFPPTPGTPEPQLLAE